MSDENAGQFDVHEAQANLSRIIERVEHGEEIIISRQPSPTPKLSDPGGRLRVSDW